MKNKFFYCIFKCIFPFWSNSLFLTIRQRILQAVPLVALKVQVVKQVRPVKTHFHVLNQLKVTQQILL